LVSVQLRAVLLGSVLVGLDIRRPMAMTPATPTAPTTATTAEAGARAPITARARSS
jgi:hypothetical protein